MVYLHTHEVSLNKIKSHLNLLTVGCYEQRDKDIGFAMSVCLFGNNTIYWSLYLGGGGGDSSTECVLKCSLSSLWTVLQVYFKIFIHRYKSYYS